MTLSDHTLQFERFTLQVRLTPERSQNIYLDFSGRIDTHNPAADIGVFLSRFHEDAVAAQVTDVIVNVSALTYVNSSSIKMFADWLLKLKQPNTYSVHFILNEKLDWQREILAPLRFLDTAKIFVEEKK